MQTNNQVLNFLQEMFQRFATKSPKFFKVWQWISGALVLITGLPDFLNLIHVTLPDSIAVLQNNAIAWASRGIFLMSLMTTQSKPAAIAEDGTILKKTDEKRLPFTAKNEANVAAKTEVVNDPQIVTPIITKT